MADQAKKLEEMKLDRGKEAGGKKGFGDEMYSKTEWMASQGTKIHIGGAEAEDDEDIRLEGDEEEEGMFCPDSRTGLPL